MIYICIVTFYALHCAQRQTSSTPWMVIRKERFSIIWPTRCITFCFYLHDREYISHRKVRGPVNQNGYTHCGNSWSLREQFCYYHPRNRSCKTNVVFYFVLLISVPFCRRYRCLCFFTRQNVFRLHNKPSSNNKITLTNFTPTLTLHKHCYLQDVLHPND